MYQKKSDTIERKEIYKKQVNTESACQPPNKSHTKKHFFQKNKVGKYATFHVGLLVCQADNCYAITYP